MEPTRGNHNGYPYFFVFERTDGDARWGGVILGPKNGIHTHIDSVNNAPKGDAECAEAIHNQIIAFIESIDND